MKIFYKFPDFSQCIKVSFEPGGLITGGSCEDKSLKEWKRTLIQILIHINLPISLQAVRWKLVPISLSLGKNCDPPPPPIMSYTTEALETQTLYKLQAGTMGSTM